MSCHTARRIQNILQRYHLQTDVDLIYLVEKTKQDSENNLRFFCYQQDDPSQQYFFKLQLSDVKQQKLKSRRQFGLKNEIVFYRQNNQSKFKKLITPTYFHSRIQSSPWLIIHKIDNKLSFLRPDIFFSNQKIPPKYIPIIIDSLTELHQMKIDPVLFHRQRMSDIIYWFSFLSPSIPTKWAIITKTVPKILHKYQKIWNSNCQFLTHSDLVPDTFAFSGSSSLVLFDFEKVQISHPAFDYSSFVINPQQKIWNKNFTSQLLQKFPSKDFIILLYISWIMRLCHLLANFSSGRLDHVYIPIIGRQKYIAVKNTYMSLWPPEIIRLLNEIKKIKL